jgi:arylsulfatase A-like enzyme
VSLKPETASRAGDAMSWRWLAASVAPNPRVLLLVTIGWVTELVLLGCVSDNIYYVSRPARWLAVMFAAWFWVTMGWVVWLVPGRLRHPLARATWRALFGVGFGLYGLSWGVYLRTSRFLDWEALRFTASNFRLLWMYARQVEHGALLGTAAALVGVSAAIVGGGSSVTSMQWSARTQQAVGDAAELRRWRRATWYGFALSWLLLLWDSGLSRNMAKLQHQEDSLRNCLHPVTTMASSWVSSQLGERIWPCIEPSELRPLTQADVWNRVAHVTNRANIVLITVESMRHDVVGLWQQGQEVMPAVNALAHDGVQFTRAYSQATQTDYATTALYSSLFPLRTRRHLYFHSNDPWPKTLFYDVLKPAGYATAIISSQNNGWGGMDNFLESPRLDLFYDPERNGALSRGGSWADSFADAQTVDKAISWIADQGTQGVPFFLGLNLQSSHFPYKLPPGASQIFQPATIDFSAGFMQYPIEKVEIVRNAYDNALHECDGQIGRLVEALRAHGQLSRTIIVVSGDHGEAFYERGYITHGREPIEPVIRTACVLYAPGMVSPHIDSYPVELVDVLPTVLGLLGLPPHPNFQGIDVLAVDRPPRERRWLFFHTENPVARTDAVLWMGRWKYAWDRARDAESLFDVETDPGETDDLSARRPELAHSLREVLQTWRRRQLAYYQFPMYYERYFPPLPPSTPTPAR